MKLEEFIGTYNSMIDELHPKKWTIVTYHLFKDGADIYCENEIRRNIIQSDYWETIKGKRVSNWNVCGHEIHVCI